MSKVEVVEGSLYYHDGGNGFYLYGEGLNGLITFVHAAGDGVDSDQVYQDPNEDYAIEEGYDFLLVAREAVWNRRDILDAYYLVESYYNVGGWLPERPSNHRRGQKAGYVAEATHVQALRIVNRMGYPKGLALFNNLTYDTLSPNGRAIFKCLISRWELPEFEQEESDG